MAREGSSGSRVFMSYRREDSIAVAGRIRDRLAHHFGAEQVFFDVDAIPLGVDFRVHIDQMVADCDVVVVVIGRRWLDATDQQGRRRLDEPGDYVRLEVEAALRREVPVIPVLVDGASIPPVEALPASIAELAFRNGIEVRHDPGFHPDMDRLIRGLPTGSDVAVTVGAAESPAATSATASGTVPPPANDQVPPGAPSTARSPRPGASILRGHIAAVVGCAVAPDGTWIASASEDKTLRIWDVASGETRRTLTGHTGAVVGCAVAPDGTWIASTSEDKTLRIWDVASGQTRRTLTGHKNPVYGCAVAPDGTWIVSGSIDETLRIWDVASGETRRTLAGHTGYVWGCAVAPDGTWIVSGSTDETLRIWDAASGETRRTLTGHTGTVWGCAVAPDGTWIVSASKDETLRIWDAASGQTRRTLTGHKNPVYGCAVAPDGTWIVSGSTDEPLRIWDVSGGQTRRTLAGHPGAVVGCAVAPDGTWIVSASTDNTLRIWDAASGRPVA